MQHIKNDIKSYQTFIDLLIFCVETDQSSPFFFAGCICESRLYRYRTDMWCPLDAINHILGIHALKLINCFYQYMCQYALLS